MLSTNLRRRELLLNLCAGLTALAATPLRAAELSDAEYLTATARVLAGFDPEIADDRFARLNDLWMGCGSAGLALHHRFVDQA